MIQRGPPAEVLAAQRPEQGAPPATTPAAAAELSLIPALLAILLAAQAAPAAPAEDWWYVGYAEVPPERLAVYADRNSLSRAGDLATILEITEYAVADEAFSAIRGRVEYDCRRRTARGIELSFLDATRSDARIAAADAAGRGRQLRKHQRIAPSRLPAASHLAPTGLASDAPRSRCAGLVRRRASRLVETRRDRDEILDRERLRAPLGVDAERLQRLERAGQRLPASGAASCGAGRRRRR